MTSNFDPVTLRVQVIAPGSWYGSGNLTIAPGHLLCSSGRFLEKMSKVNQVRQDGTRVEIYRARLSQLWGALSIPIRGDGDVLIASVFLLNRTKLRRVLHEAGFEVVEHASWVYRGFRRSELKRKVK